jgi:hypothetical protein
MRRCASVSAVLLLVFGCGGPSDQPELGTVTGKVTLNGQAVEDALVEFIPKDGGRPSTGQTDTEGNYELSYSASEMGAKVGTHSVRVSTLVAQELDDSGKPVEGTGRAEEIPESYNVKSTLEKEVKAGDNEINLELTK